MKMLPVNHNGVPRLHTAVDDDVYEWASQQAWSIERSGVGRGGKGGWYVRGTIDGRKTFLHQAVMEITPGRLAPRVDHINGCTIDNRRCNLRIATAAQNAQNQGSRGGSSRYRGVTWDKSRQKWMASAMLDGRRKTIGRFDSEEDANAAACAWRAIHMPFSLDAREAA